MFKFVFLTNTEPLKAEGCNLAGSCKFSSAMACAVFKIFLQLLQFPFLCITFYKYERYESDRSSKSSCAVMK
jgi:hypothetical protein